MAANKFLKNEIINLRKEGYKLTEISIKLNCSLANVKYHCNKNGLSSQIKITKDKFDEMLQLIKDGMILKDVSKKMNISISTIKRYKNKTYDELNVGRKYMSTFMIDNRKKLKIKAVEYKGGCCVFCNYSKCYTALSFHHIDADLKDFQISGTNRSWENIKKELDKCILVCNNCHAEIHEGIRDINHLS